MSLQKVVYGFIPTSITGCALWLDGADPAGNGVVPGTGTLATWVDKSGNGFNASSQLTAATSTQNAVNGLNSISFNGTSRYLTSVTGFNNSAYTIFVVQYTTSITGAGGSSGYQRTVHGSTGNQYVFIGTYNGNVATFSGSGSAWNDVAANSTNVYNYNSSRIVCMQVSGSILSPYTDGSSQTTKTGTTGSFSSFYIGNDNANTQPWYGFISEIIIYNSAFGTTQRQQVEGYLAQKWGLTSSLPAIHPGLGTTLYRADFTKQNVMRAIPYHTQFSPKSVPNCLIWFDAADSTTLGLTGTTVNTWTSKGSYTGNAAASTGTVSSGTIKQNGLNVISFPAGSQITYTVAMPNQARVWFFVMRNTTQMASNKAYWLPINQSGGGQDSIVVVYGSGGSTYNIYMGPAGISVTVDTLVMPEPFNVMKTYVMQNSAVSTASNAVSINGSTYTLNNNSLASGFATGSLTYSISTNWPNVGMDLCEMIVYNGEITATERQQVESYLAQKWGLTASLPGGHSHATQPAGAITRTALANLRLVIQPRRYTSFRWTITAGNTENLIQFSEFQVGFNSTQLVFASPTTATTGSSISWNTGAGEGPAQAVDNNINTKGLGIGTSGLVLIVTVATPIAANMYRWATANDVTPGRNPTQWTVDGSADGVTFVRLHTQNTAYSTPSSTFTYTSWINFTYS